MDLRAQPLTASGFGAAITGVDLRVTPASALDGAALRSLLHEHGFLLFRRGGGGAAPSGSLSADSPPLLTPQQQWAVYQHFDHVDFAGDYRSADYLSQGGSWNILEEEPHTEVLGTVEGARSNPLAAGFALHTDGIMYTSTPPSTVSMYAVETPANGAGDTRFMSGALAYEALSPSTRERADGLYQVLYTNANAKHPQRVTATNGTRIEGDVQESTNNEGEPMDWESCEMMTTTLVRSHPVTGRRSIWTNGGRVHRLLERDRATGRLTALGVAETRQLMEALLAPGLAAGASVTHSHQWAVGDLVVFDNCQILHQATDPLEYEGHRRHLQRIEMRGSWSQADCLAHSQWLRSDPARPQPPSRPVVYPISVRFDVEHATGDILPRTFGAAVVGLSPGALKSNEVRQMLRSVWQEHGGLLVVRGLIGLSAEELADFSEIFGAVEQAVEDTLRWAAHPEKDEDTGELLTSFDEFPSLPTVPGEWPSGPGLAASQYNLETRLPVFHTDSPYREVPPLGSVLYCKQTPPPAGGGATIFADTSAAFSALPEEKQIELEGLEAICSLTHHDYKIYRLTHNDQLPPADEGPLVAEAVRWANPPRRAPIVLTHPETGKKCLYGLNGSTCAIVKKGSAVTEAQLEIWDWQGIEDPSVQIWREMLPFVTSPEFAVDWKWSEGDAVLYDNRSLIHAASGFDAERFTREMWRTTILPPQPALEGGGDLLLSARL